VAGGTGLSVPCDDANALAAALRDVVTDSAATAARVEQGRLRASAFTWEHAAAELWRLHVRFFEMADAR